MHDSIKKAQMDQANGVMRPTIKTTTIGTVLKSDEMNNTITVEYTYNNQVVVKDNVVVRLYGSGTDYFPDAGEKVTLEVSHDACVMIARSISSYAGAVRSKMKKSHDIYSDSSVGLGGVAF